MDVSYSFLLTQRAQWPCLLTKIDYKLRENEVSTNKKYCNYLIKIALPADHVSKCLFLIWKFWSLDLGET